MCHATISLDLWCAGAEHIYDGQRQRWRSCGFVSMDREQRRTSVGIWPRDRRSGVTTRGGWQLGHALARGHGKAGRVTGTVEDWRDTYPGRGGAHAVHYSRLFRGWSSKPTSCWYCWVLASKLNGDGHSGNWRWHMVSSWMVRRDEATSSRARGRTSSPVVA
jgi:hypothetical protein